MPISSSSAGRTLGSIILAPFWAAGRLTRMAGSAVTYVVDAFRDGLDGDTATNNTTSSTVLALVVVWSVVLTLRVF